MAKSDVTELQKLLEPFSPATQEIAWRLRDFVWDRYPECNELIYSGYAVGAAWTPTDRLGHAFCSFAVYRSNEGIHFGFYWGAELRDAKKMLLGSGKQYRFLRVPSLEEFPFDYVEDLLQEAHVNSLAKVKDERHLKTGLTIVKAASEKKKAVKTPKG